MPVNLGMAHGEISIGTTGVTGAERQVKASAARMTSDMGGVGKGVGGLQSKFQQLDSFLGASFLIGAAVGIGKAALELGRASAQAELTKSSFDRLAAGVGQSSDDMLAGMRTASRGVISDSVLILGANRAIGSGMADTGAELNQILEIARATAQTYGVTTSEAFGKIVEGVSKLEPELVDQLGITVQLDQVYRAYAASIGTTSAKLTDMQKKQAFLNEIIRQSKDEVEAAAGELEPAADKYGRLDTSLEKLGKTTGDLLNTGGGVSIVSVLTRDIDAGTAKLQAYIDLIEQFKAVMEGVGAALGVPQPAAISGTAPWGTRGAPTMGPAYTPRSDSTEVAQAKLDFGEGVQEINSRMHDEIIDLEADFGRQRADTVANYNKSVAREERDFGISRARQEAAMLDSIADIHATAARREADAAEDLSRTISRSQADSAERISDAREDAGKRLVEMEEDFAKNRERAAEDHRDKMLSAAGRLDAVTLLEERKNWARQSKDAEEAHSEQRSDLQEQLAERIADENESLAESIADAKEAHDRQREDARENDAMRLEDMKADFEQRKAEEDADRARRLSDQAIDHADQLAEMDRAHGSRLAQIHIHAQEERDKLDLEHAEEMKRLEAASAEQLKQIERVEKARKKIYDEVWGVDALTGHPSEADPYIDRELPGYARGGFVPRTGPAYLHAGEFVMPAPMVAAGGRSSSKHVTVGDINVYGAQGQDEELIGEIVNRRLLRFLEAP